jgi:anaerobic ribonucleoside-triphosphate reductase activating protein
LFQRISDLGESIEGITISGGEPLQQPRPLLALLKKVRAHTPLSILIFSGYTWEEIQGLPFGPEILAHCDVLIAGRYVASQRLAHGLLGSTNKRVHLLTERYTMIDLQEVPPAEVLVTPDGEVLLSGIDPLNW